MKVPPWSAWSAFLRRWRSHLPALDELRRNLFRGPRSGSRRQRREVRLSLEPLEEIAGATDLVGVAAPVLSGTLVVMASPAGALPHWDGGRDVTPTASGMDNGTPSPDNSEVVLADRGAALSPTVALVAFGPPISPQNLDAGFTFATTTGDDLGQDARTLLNFFSATSARPASRPAADSTTPPGAGATGSGSSLGVAPVVISFASGAGGGSVAAPPTDFARIVNGTPTAPSVETAGPVASSSALPAAAPAQPAGTTNTAALPILIATGSGPGAPPEVDVFDARTGREQYHFRPYEDSFRGGVHVALADLNHDGLPDVIVAPGPGRAPELGVFDGHDGTRFSGPLGNLMAFAPAFTSGVFVAAGDVDGDGTSDLIVGQAADGAQVRVFSGHDGSRLSTVEPYPGFRGGVRLAAADLNGDRHAEIITAPGPGGPPLLRAFSSSGQALTGPWGGLLAYEPSFTGGVFVAMADVDGDGTPDVIAGPGEGHSPEVKVISGHDGSVRQRYLAFDPSFTGGVRVAGVALDGDSSADVVAAAGPGGSPEVRAFSGATSQPFPAPAGDFLAGDPAFTGGLFVAGAIDPDPIAITATISPIVQQLPLADSVASKPASLTISWDADFPDEGLGSVNATIDWGDGTIEAGGSSNGPIGSATDTHIYYATGTYTVTVTLLAGYATVESGTATLHAVVLVMDPPAPLPADNDCGCGGSNSPGDALSQAGGLGALLFSAGASTAPVRPVDGRVRYTDTDLSSDSFGMPWGLTRSWSNDPSTAPDGWNSYPSYAAGGWVGMGWVTTQLPSLVSSGMSLAVVGNAGTARIFDLDGNGNLVERYADQDTLTHHQETPAGQLRRHLHADRPAGRPHRLLWPDELPRTHLPARDVR